MATLTDNKEKMAIVERLVKDGHIDFAEAIKLLEKETQIVRLPQSEPTRYRDPYVDVIGDEIRRRTTQKPNPLGPIWEVETNSIPYGFLQTEGTIHASAKTTAITGTGVVNISIDEKGRMRDHNGKKMAVSYT